MTAISPTREDDYAQWYQEVIVAAELAEHAPVRGCMVIKPWGYAIWENIQQYLDQRFKETGHVNAYFPLLIPLSFLQKEATHVAGFAKECAIVTHRQLQAEEDGTLTLAEKLEEPLVVRPTSEAIIGSIYAGWIKSHRDLPILLNQWANVVRWEKRPRLFLRTSEFLWQEGHTAHATQTEAVEETLKILDIYTDFAINELAIPVFTGEKTASERFPGAVNTYCIEGMMQDGKALQLGTSHFLGQNFAKAYGMEFLGKEGKLETAWTTSWGVSTRLIGGLIMTHSDDNGLVLPPRIAPHQIVIIPVHAKDQQAEIRQACQDLQHSLKNIEFAGRKLRVHVDNRDLTLGDKNWGWIKKGIPLIIALGARDINNGTISVTRRDHPLPNKHMFNISEFPSKVANVLEDIQLQLLTKAKQYRDKHTVPINNLAEFQAFFNQEEARGFVKCYASDNAGDSAAIEEYLAPLKASARCIIMEDTEIGQCIFTGQPNARKTIFARSY